MALSVGEHLRCPEGSLINGRYKIMKEVGCGNFAKVYKCNDTQKPGSSPVAVKILKREYATDANFEHDILKSLRTKAQGRKVVQLLDQFNFQRYPCFVFKLQGATLRSRKMGVKQGRVSMSDIRRLSQEMLATLAFLHQDVKMVHTDLKPENILLDSEGSSSDAIGDGWTIADFGSASFYRPERPDSDLISTRPYRAPEVVLGMTWSPKADVWSMACILFEVYYGGRLFEVHDDHEHIHRFDQRLGRVPTPFARQSKHFRKFFDERGVVLPQRRGPGASSASAANHVSRSMAEILQDEPEFFDMLNQMLRYDPTQRISAADALKHPFLSGGATTSRSASASSAAAVISARTNANSAPTQQNAVNSGRHVSSSTAIDILADKENQYNIRGKAGAAATDSNAAYPTASCAAAQQPPHRSNSDPLVAPFPTKSSQQYGVAPPIGQLPPPSQQHATGAGSRWGLNANSGAADPLMAAGRPSARYQPTNPTRRLF